jgi:hypothetical protein
MPGEGTLSSPGPVIIGVKELARLVAELQRRATVQPGVKLEATYAWVEYDPAVVPDDQVEALYAMGRPYNLVLARRRAPGATR